MIPFLDEMENLLKSDDFTRDLLYEKMFWVSSELNAINWDISLKNDNHIEQLKTYFLILVPVFLAISVIIVFLSYKDKKRQRNNLNELLAQTIKAHEEERAKISRELHDTLAQDMRYVNLLANEISKDDLKAEIKQHQTDCINQLRDICSSYAVPNLVATGIIPSLQKLIMDFKTHSNCECKLTVLDDVDFSVYNNDQLLNIYRIIQEALQNIIKHANASEASILIRRNTDPKSLRLHKLIITDDGSGIDSELLEIINSTYGIIEKNDGKHFGIKGIKERVEMLEGTIKIDSVVNEGTELLIEM